MADSKVENLESADNPGFSFNSSPIAKKSSLVSTVQRNLDKFATFTILPNLNF
jgi:hypothetical protein